MLASRALLLIPAFLMVLLPIDAGAQGRGNGNKNRGGKGNGPAFCRSGEGHPVHGWEWCRQRGWDGAYRSAGSRTAVRRAEPRPRAASSDRYGGRRINDPAFDNDGERYGEGTGTSRFPWPF